MSLTIKTINSLHSVSAKEWNILGDYKNPFTQYEFLIALENNGAVGKEFGWITNFHVCTNNIDDIANKGGRLRWKIENEGFNVRKNKIERSIA